MYAYTSESTESKFWQISSTLGASEVNWYGTYVSNDPADVAIWNVYDGSEWKAQSKMSASCSGTSDCAKVNFSRFYIISTGCKDESDYKREPSRYFQAHEFLNGSAPRVLMNYLRWGCIVLFHVGGLYSGEMNRGIGLPGNIQ